MLPEHVKRSFLDPEYSLDEYFQLGSRRKVGPVKNGLYDICEPVFMYYTVCYFTSIFYVVVIRPMSMVFIDNKDSVFCIRLVRVCWVLTAFCRKCTQSSNLSAVHPRPTFTVLSYLRVLLPPQFGTFLDPSLLSHRICVYSCQVDGITSPFLSDRDPL